MNRTPALCALLLGTALPAAAQTRPIIKPGDMVRLVTAQQADQRVQGRVLRLNRDSVTIEAPDDVRTMANGTPALQAVTFPFGDLRSIEVQEKGRSHAAEGALIGGGLMFGLVMLSTTPLLGSNEAVFSLGEGFRAGLMIGGAAAVVGAFLGSTSNARGWKPAALPEYAPRLDVGMRGITVRWGFTF